MKRRILLIFILVFILAAAIVLVCGARNSKRVMASATQETEAAALNPVVCVYYADTYLSLDKNGVVCSNSSGRPAGVPLSTGISFLRLTYGKTAEAQEPSALQYVLRVAADLDKQQIPADKISYENRMVTVYTGMLEIQLGKNEKTDDKITDLADFIGKLDGQSGTLFMQNGNANNYGYTFRAN